MFSRAALVVVNVFTSSSSVTSPRADAMVFVASSRGPALATSPRLRPRASWRRTRANAPRARASSTPAPGEDASSGKPPDQTPVESSKPSSEKLTPEARGFLAALDTAPLVVAQTAPAVRVALSEEFGRPPGAFSPGQLVAALRALGVHKVLDTNTAADLCVCEEGTELLQRLHDAEAADDAARGGRDEADAEVFSPVPAPTAPLPMFTSCCPGWIQLVEKTMPDLWPYVSSCKSPHMMLGALLKRVTRDVWGGHEPEDVFLVSVMPCVRKKGESLRPEFAAGGVRDVDEVITTRDLGALLRLRGIDPGTLEPSAFDRPFGEGSGAGQLFGVTGGVMEAAVRTVYAVVTEGETLPRLELEDVRGFARLKECEVSLKSPSTGKGMDRSIRLAVVSGLAEAKTLIRDMRDGARVYDFVEVMACPGGCVGGGGQPRSKDPDAARKRADAVYELDRCAAVRQSHHNPAIAEVYERWLGPGFGSDAAKEALHVERPDSRRRDRDDEDDVKTRETPFPRAASTRTMECETCGLRYDVE